MQEAHLYDISYGKNKFDSSFEVYLYSYQVPYVFVNPTLTAYDKLTFTHEFGHFCSDYASFGSVAGVDVAEVFSQGLEYLSLCYTQNNEDLKKLRMASCLTTYVEQAAYAYFEHQVYDLSSEELTVEHVRALYQSVGSTYGFDSWNWDSRDYVCISHFFTSPMYIISYVVSNDAAFQLYQMEQSSAGSGLACYRENLATREAYFLSFLQSAGLESPFLPGRLEAVKETLQAILQ
jgi:oligoendopeptidase F